METKIQKMHVDWTEVKNECRNTTNKEATDVPATKKFIKQILISEHSPIRLIRIKWRWEGIKSWISVHFARHWLGWDKWISTQRTDRTGINRDAARQDTLVNMDVEANAQALINVGRYRLCFQSAPETREKMEDLKMTIHMNGQEELAHVLCPNCVYRAGCPEFPEHNNCKFWKKFCERHAGEDLLNIENRYRLYNEDFYQIHQLKEDK